MNNNTVINLSEYIKRTSEEIGKSGGDPNAVYDSSVSDAMIACHGLACEYATLRKNKNPPIPNAVINKASDDEAYTQFKFSTDINTESLKKAITKTKNPESINVVEYGNSINVEIYTDTKNKKEAISNDFGL